MQFVTVRDFRNSSAAIWKRLSEVQDMVVTNNGKPVAILTPVNEQTLESTIADLRRIRAIKAVRQMQEISAQLGNDKMTLEEINEIIAETRKGTKNANCD